MADQTMKIERDDVAAVAAALADRLWYAETKQNPKASDEKFMKLVAICAWALSAKGSPDHIEGHIKAMFPK